MADDEKVTYYISAIVDLNNSVIKDSSSLGFYATTLSSTSNAVTSYNFPDGSADVSLGTINATGAGVNISGGLSGIIRVNVDSSGFMSSQVIIDGSGFVAHVDEDPNKAQYVYWGDTHTDVTATSADVLTASYTKDQAKTDYESVISKIQSDYSGNMIQSWNFHIPKIDPSTESAIYKYAETYTRFDTSFVFHNGEEIVLKTAFPYTVSITDIYNQLVTIIHSTDIYAILKHDNSGVIMDKIV